jgi:hypothetical protein
MAVPTTGDDDFASPFFAMVLNYYRHLYQYGKIG